MRPNLVSIPDVAKKFNRDIYESLAIVKFCIANGIALYKDASQLLPAGHDCNCFLPTQDEFKKICSSIALEEDISLCCVLRHINLKSFIPYARKYGPDILSNSTNKDPIVTVISFQLKNISSAFPDIQNTNNPDLKMFKKNVKKDCEKSELLDDIYLKLAPTEANDLITACDNLFGECLNKNGLTISATRSYLPPITTECIDKLQNLYIKPGALSKLITDFFPKFNNWLSVDDINNFCVNTEWTYKQAICLSLGINPSIALKRTTTPQNCIASQMLNEEKISSFPFIEELKSQTSNPSNPSKSPKEWINKMIENHSNIYPPLKDKFNAHHLNQEIFGIPFSKFPASIQAVITIYSECWHDLPNDMRTPNATDIQKVMENYKNIPISFNAQDKEKGRFTEPANKICQIANPGMKRTASDLKPFKPRSKRHPP